MADPAAYLTRSRVDAQVLTPHCAPHTPDFAAGTAELLVNNLERWHTGDPLLKQISIADGY